MSNRNEANRPSAAVPGGPRRSISDGAVELLESRRLLSAAAAPLLDMAPLASGGFSGYSPAQIASAYAFNHVAVPTGAKAGAGQTIAIVDAYNDPNITSDLATFDSHFGLSAPPSFKIVSQTGSGSLPATNAGWGVEITLDVEWAHAMAPGANILLVEANSASDTDLLAAINTARKTTGVSVVSMSWGGPDFNGQTSDDSYFTTPAGHAPVTFVAASGDGGSASGPDWPADSPNVLAVGGTSITINSSGLDAGETGWADSTGGVSNQETEPAYQRVAQSTGHRSEPDVAYDANPNSGFAVYDSLASGGLSGWYIAGGASAGSPQWAALIAIADQLRVYGGKSTLDGPSVTLPTLYAAYSTSKTYSGDFHDITSGSSSASISAKAGYDEVTGLGSPIATGIVQSLIAGTTASAVTKSVTSSAVSYVKKFATHHVIATFGPAAATAPIPSSSAPSGGAAAPAAGAILLQTQSAAQPAASLSLTPRFTSNPILAPTGATMELDAGVPIFPAAVSDDGPEIPDPTSSDAPLDANHPFWHITQATPDPDDAPTAGTDDHEAPFTTSRAIKSAAAIGLTALLVILAASQTRANRAATGELESVPV